MTLEIIRLKFGLNMYEFQNYLTLLHPKNKIDVIQINLKIG